MKLLRGLLRHPSAGIRVSACRELLSRSGWGQDECWEQLSDEEQANLRAGRYACCTAQEIAKWRQRNQDRGAAWFWKRYSDRDLRRVFTTMNNNRLRRDFCRLYELEYPGDHDTGCPADLPPPATIVTENGDVPLVGSWPP